MPSLGFFFDVHHSPQVNLLKRMLRLDPVMVDEQYEISKERVITDELISLGALTPEQLDVVLRCVRRALNFALLCLPLRFHYLARACSRSLPPDFPSPARTSVSSERRREDEEQERKWGKAVAKHGAMGDAVSDLIPNLSKSK